ncbi:MAG: tyrosine-type recombinase/integrase [Rikenellaceae bacterium]
MNSFPLSITPKSKSSKEEKEKTIKVRMKVNAYYGKTLVTAHATIGVELPLSVWENKIYIKKSYLNEEKYGTKYKKLKKTIDEIYEYVSNRINATISKSNNATQTPSILITSEWLQALIQNYWADVEEKIIKAAKEREAKKKKETLSRYITRYVSEISCGKRINPDTGLMYSKNTIKSVKNSMTYFEKFQDLELLGHRYNFEDIDLNVYNKYVSWLTSSCQLNTNTVGKTIKDLKSIMNKSLDEGLHDNIKHKAKAFKVSKIEVDNIYLTQDELNTIYSLDLSDKAKGYELARDVFLLGCCIAQRVSDYTRIKESDISTDIVEVTRPDGSILQRETTRIRITQEKGSKRVIVPLNEMARQILAKYNNDIPYIWQQNLNENIKVVCRWAGITEPTSIEYNKGGRKITETSDKCDLVSSHTARRTGATLMYLSGMDAYDICKITGHTSIKMLRKYIKADELDVAVKMVKYNYFM